MTPLDQMEVYRTVLLMAGWGNATLAHPSPVQEEMARHPFEPLFYAPKECHDCGKSREEHE